MKISKVILISSLVLAGTLFFSMAADSQTELWYLLSNRLRPNVSTWGLQVPSLANCTGDIQTNASGIFSCGTDDTGTGFSTSTGDYWFDHTTGITGNTNIITVGTLTTANGNISLWNNDSGYIKDSYASSTYALAKDSTTTNDYQFGLKSISDLSDVGAMTESPGDLLYVGTDNQWTRLASSTNGKVLGIGTNGYPTWISTTTWDTDTNTTYIADNPITLNGTVFGLNNTSSTENQTAYNDRLKWDGGATDLVAATGRTSLELSSTNSVSFANINNSGIATTTELCFTDGSCQSTVNVISSEVIFYPQNRPDEIAGYQQMLRTTPNQAEATASCTQGGPARCAIEEFIATSTAMNTTLIPAGTWYFDVYASVSGGATSYVEVNVFKRASGGTETNLFQATTTALTTATPLLYVVETTQPFFTILTTDRLVVKYVYYQSGVPSRTATLYYDNSAHASYVKTPFVSNIQLGSYVQSDVDETITGKWSFTGDTLTTKNLTTTYNGSFGTTTITGKLTTGGFISSASSTIVGKLNVTDYITAAGFTGNASTADALKVNPNDCASGSVANTIDASGNLGCIATSTWDTNTTYTADNPVVLNGTVFGINNSSTSNWNNGYVAYGWGNHASANYLTQAIASSTYFGAGDATSTMDAHFATKSISDLADVGAITETSGQILYTNASGQWVALASSTDGYVLTLDANGYPSWAAASGGGGSNWNFGSVNAIRPTTTVGIIVSASSTISNLTVTYATATQEFVVGSAGAVDSVIDLYSGANRVWTMGLDYSDSGKFKLSTTSDFSNNVFSISSSTGNVIFTGTLTAYNLSGTNTGDQDLTSYLTKSKYFTTTTWAGGDQKLTVGSGGFISQASSTVVGDFYAGNTTTLFVDANGYIGIATSTPSTTFSIGGNTYTSGDIDTRNGEIRDLICEHRSITNPASTTANWYTTTTQFMTVDQNLRFAKLTASNGTMNKMNGTTTAYFSSSSDPGMDLMTGGYTTSTDTSLSNNTFETGERVFLTFQNFTGYPPFFAVDYCYYFDKD